MAAMGVNLQDATEITDPDEEWEDRLIEDPLWQRVIFDEFGEVDWYQVPRFAHWEDWRWWVRRTRPGEEPILMNGVLGYRMWWQGPWPPCATHGLRK